MRGLYFGILFLLRWFVGLEFDCEADFRPSLASKQMRRPTFRLVSQIIRLFFVSEATDVIKYAFVRSLKDIFLLISCIAEHAF